MLVLSRFRGEAIIVKCLCCGEEARVVVVAGEGRVKLGIDAGLNMRIDREEVHLSRQGRQTQSTGQEQVG